MTDAASQPPLTAEPAAERRQVTALFADMVGFTEIAERLEEEGTLAFMRPIFDMLGAAVVEQGGRVKDFTGDGVMALFGAPEAIEDAPLRACRAGLLIQERLARATPGIKARYGVEPKIRVGINSGPVVITQLDGQKSLTALGDTVNFASRLEALAAPGTVYLSEATQRLVEGRAKTTFVGLFAIKGKAGQQRVYRLDSAPEGATRFDAAVQRGLTAYVGRDGELQILEDGFAAAAERLQVVDIVAEAGMGKSRLLYEFRARVRDKKPLVLSGHCTPDGQGTPFLPLIEIVRRSFGISAGEAEPDVVRQLESGLARLDLTGQRHLGLLLNLLGLKPPPGSLAGLTGVLIGLRTRELLHRLLKAVCDRASVIMIVEDLHWIDSVSAEVLGKFVDWSDGRRLLILHTRRPEWTPPWIDRPNVKTLTLTPLPTDQVRRLVEARLGVASLPETFARLVTEKADGNALFAEEIVSFLKERGVLRASGGMAEFDAGPTSVALPANVEALLTARVDRLPRTDRELLQAAAAIGRRFDPQLLAAVVNVPFDVGARLATLQGLDLVYPSDSFGGYAFKHAILRDALYHTLLSGPRALLHLKIAQEIERRSGNRLIEVSDELAHHYSQTDRADRAFAYLAMAGAKSLRIYSLDEAERYFAAAIAVVDRNPDCASDEQFADLLVNYALCSNISLKLKPIIEIPERFRAKLDGLGDSHQRILIQHHYITTLVWSAKFPEAQKEQNELLARAERLGDPLSKAYALASGLSLSTHFAPKPSDVFEKECREALAAASAANDIYLQNFIVAAAGWDALNRGRMGRARETAEELMAVGRRMNDPRSIGYALAVESLIALMSDDYAAALELAERSVDISVAPFERETANSARHAALVLLRRPDGLVELQNFLSRCRTNGWMLLHQGPEDLLGVALIINGKPSEGVRLMNEAIVNREREGYQASADWCRMFLCEVYLEMLAGKRRPSARALLQNFKLLVTARLTGEKRIRDLIARVRANPQFDPNGHYIARCEMILGLLAKVKRRPAEARQHLSEARRITSQFGPSPMLRRIEKALAEVA